MPTTEPAACIPASTSEPPRKHRAHSVGPQEIFLLDQWGRQLYEAFHAMPYLVGSVARGERYWRDVDVRMPLEDDAWPFDEERPSRLFALNLAISLWGRQATGLPVDFQFQRQSVFQVDEGVRNPLGVRSMTKWEAEAAALRRAPRA